MIATFDKKEGDVLDYEIDFARWLPDGDTIVSASASIDTEGTAEIDSTEYSETQVQVWVSGGTAGESATVTVTATTDQGRTKSECFRLRIKDC